MQVIHLQFVLSSVIRHLNRESPLNINKAVEFAIVECDCQLREVKCCGFAVDGASDYVRLNDSY